jgi:hypothetical protein
MDATAEGEQNNLKQNNSMNHQNLHWQFQSRKLMLSCQLEAAHSLKFEDKFKVGGQPDPAQEERS